MSDIYDEADLALIADDWYIKRFLLAKNRDVEAAFKMLDETMRWRNDMFISQIRDYHFPSEFYKIGGLFPYEPDNEGNVVLYMRIRMHHKVLELEEPTRGFVVHNFNKTEKLSRGQGFAIVFDLTGAGYSNLDTPFLTFLINFGRNHFPGSLCYILVYNLPWVLSAMQKVAFAMLPPEAAGIIKFASGSDIFKYIPPENVPDYIPGGLCRRNFRSVAPGAKPILDLVLTYGYTHETYDRIFPTFKRDLDEAAAVLAIKTYDDPPEGFFDDITGVEITPLPLPSKRVRVPKERPEEQEEKSIQLFPPVKTEGRDRILSFFPTDILDFVYDGTSYVSELDLKNQTDTLIAYKVLSTNPKNYRVSPYKGILLPNSSLRITLMNVRSDGIRFKEKFMLVAKKVDNSKMSAQEFRRIWSTDKHLIHTFKLSARLAHDSSDDLMDSSLLMSSLKSEPPSEPDFPTQIRLLNHKIRKLERKYSNLFLVFSIFAALTLALLAAIILHSVCGPDSFDVVTKNIPSKVHKIQESVCSFASSAATS